MLNRMTWVLAVAFLGLAGCGPVDEQPLEPSEELGDSSVAPEPGEELETSEGAICVRCNTTRLDCECRRTGTFRECRYYLQKWCACGPDRCGPGSRYRCGRYWTGWSRYRSC